IEVRGERCEGDEPPVGGEGGVEGDAGGQGAGGAARAADERGGVRLQVANEQVPAGQAVGRIEVRGQGRKRDETSVGRDCGRVRLVVPLGGVCAACPTDKGGRVRLQVAHEHLLDAAVGVGGEVRGEGLEGDVAPVGRDCCVLRRVVRLGAARAGRAADECGGVRLAVADKHVQVVVRIGRIEV